MTMLDPDLQKTIDVNITMFAEKLADVLGRLPNERELAMLTATVTDHLAKQRQDAIDAQVRHAEAVLDAQIALILESDEIDLLDLPMSQADRAKILAKHKARVAKEKAAFIDEIRRGLSDWSAPSSKLQ